MYNIITYSNLTKPGSEYISWTQYTLPEAITKISSIIESLQETGQEIIESSALRELEE